MKEKTKLLYEVNSDLIHLLRIAGDIGWKELREASIQRILYLSSVLYSFMYQNRDKPFSKYHFSLSPTGPYSEIIERSIVDLRVREILKEDHSGKIDLTGEFQKYNVETDKEKIAWLQVIIYILGVYGESKIFGFVIQDPEYKDNFQRNSKVKLDVSDQNKSIQTLNKFKSAFEQTLTDVSEIDDKEYLELYFEYIFSKILKKEDY